MSIVSGSGPASARKLQLAAAATAAYLLLLVSIYWLHARFFTVDVVLYAALLDVVIATAIAGLVFWRAGPSRCFNAFEGVQLVCIWGLLGALLALAVPTVIDRSLSFYILEKLQQRGGSIAERAFGDVFRIEYMAEHRLIDVRLTEQLESGTIVLTDGCVRLTRRGELLASFSRAFRAEFLPRKRLLMGEYSDHLTDPFRHSTQSVDYRCDSAASSD